MKRPFSVVFLLLVVARTGFCDGKEGTSLFDIEPDLQTPAVVKAKPAPGLRVWAQIAEYEGTDVHHALYLPTDWEPGKTYPVIVEYAGNEYRTSPGTVEGSNLGYGISGGKGFIWVCLPYVNKEKTGNEKRWWGNLDATVDYCKLAVPRICSEFGGDPRKVLIAGFSRGAIACNYIGLHDDDIAGIWLGFICHSHYDGVKTWKYEASDRDSAIARLKRLAGRPQWISHEKEVKDTRQFLEGAKVNGQFTFIALPYPEHTDEWVLRDILERRIIRAWVSSLCEKASE